ncbi:cell division topological specificity factor MinE [Synergistes jonesii]|uniref:cell division topological specificity factor MinE n=1 Tax=Synergistes jonesii TaxID=2754 RepID=UPI0031E578F5
MDEVGILDCLGGLFGRQKSGSVAKERLQLVLIHDRNDISPEILNALRGDLINTIKKYLEIDENGIELDLNREDHSVALLASIPLKNMRRHAPEAPQAQQKTSQKVQAQEKKGKKK